MATLSSDRPLGDPQDDRLGYAPFAKQLAASLSTLVPAEGLVMAIYGPWGSGKTTVLNFTKAYLSETDNPPVVMDFNPWWFAGHEDLALRFFDQLLSVLNKRKVFTETLQKKLAGFAALLAEAPAPDIAKGSGRLARKLLEPSLDATARKREIADELRKQQKRILVVMDDIDRLSVEEVRQLFQVIKAVADFPSVIYLLAFDKEVAVKALSGVQGLPGEAYLEKIVQVPFELPLPEKTALRRLLFEKLDQVLFKTPDDLFDSTYWGNVYFEGLDGFIETPRNITVLTNTLHVTYPAVRGELNAVDFVAVEALRVFMPQLYDLLRRNPQAFAGHSSGPSLTQPSIESLKPFHQAWLDSIPEKEQRSTKALLRRLFPKLEAVWANTSYGAQWEGAWRKQRRVCSPDVFPVFFRLAVPDAGISNVEMKAILAIAADPDAFGRHLVELASQMRPDGMTRVREVLERLQDYTSSDIPTDNIPAVIEAILNVGDQLLRPEDDRRGMLDFGNDIQMLRITWQLLQRLDRASRLEVLKRAITRGSAIATIVHEITTYGQEQGKYGSQAGPEANWTITAEGLQELEGLALHKLRQAAADGSLLRVPKLPSLLYAWRDWATDDEVKKWIEEVTAEDDNLLAVVEKFGSTVFDQALTDTVGRKGYRLNPKSLEPFFDLRDVADRLQHLLETRDDLDDARRKAAEEYLREYEIVKKGKNPDDPMSWMQSTQEGQEVGNRPSGPS